DLQKSLSNFWGSCHRGRGRGPTTASLSVARAMMALGGAGVSEANGVPTGDDTSSHYFVPKMRSPASPRPGTM
ncbi:MAG: hypothetical protein J5907_05960, partial [Bacteroidales bacterium]|nr:hypothetical protein [Bacteroidales bacterium]